VTRRRATSRNPSKAQQRIKERGAAPKAATNRRLSASSKDREVARVVRERDDAVEQLSATSEVLKVISSSPGDLRSVFAAILANAVRICEAKFGNIYRWDGELLRLVATHNTPAAFVEARRQPWRPSPNIPMGRMVASKSVTHVVDMMAETAYSKGNRTLVESVEIGGARSYLAVPILRQDELIGAIGIFRQEVRPFTDKQIELIKSFAAQAVIAIENARLLNELRQSLEQQTATSEVLKVISGSPGELKPVFVAMLENAVRICDAKFGNLMLYDGKAYQFAALHGAPPAREELARRQPVFSVRPNSPLGRLATTRRLEHKSISGAPAGDRCHSRIGRGSDAAERADA
jgi:hypothetical protein